MVDVVEIKVDELIPYVNNSRTHSDEQIAQVAASIREFGFTNPVLIDKNKTIIAGHGRVLAARKLKLDSVPTITLDGLTENQIKAYVMADNQLAANAGWDLDLLKLELDELKLADFDIDLIGFGDDFLADLFHEETEGLTDEDAVPDAPENPVSVLGDVWILGNHRLMCGDSTSIDAVEKLMDGRKANICFTSPPYNAGSMNVKGNKRTGKKYNSFDDNQTPDEFFEFLTENMRCYKMFAESLEEKIYPLYIDETIAFSYIDTYLNYLQNLFFINPIRLHVNFLR